MARRVLIFLALVLLGIGFKVLGSYRTPQAITMDALVEVVNFEPSHPEVLGKSYIARTNVSDLSLEGFSTIRLGRGRVTENPNDAAATDAVTHTVDSCRITAADSRFNSFAHFDSPSLHISDFYPYGASGIKLKLSGVINEVQWQVRGGRPRLFAATQGREVSVSARDCQTGANLVGSPIPLSRRFHFEPDSTNIENSEITIRFSGDGDSSAKEQEVALFYGIRKMGKDLNLLNTKIQVDRIDFGQSPLNSTLTRFLCLRLVAGGKSIPVGSGLQMYANIEDLEGFQLERATAETADLLRVSLRGETARFRAGTSQQPANRVEPAVSGVLATWVQLVAVVLAILQFLIPAVKAMLRTKHGGKR